MSDRKRQVLKAVVSEYINTAEPVGSRTLVRQHKFGVSTATIRNEMADLEEMGFLEQPHVSAGRVPSDQGYRFYVDNLMSEGSLTVSEKQSLDGLVAMRLPETEAILASASRTLSKVADCIALVSNYRPPEDCLTAVKLVYVEEQLCLLLLFTENGLAESRFLMLPSEIRPLDLQELAGYFTEKLVGKPITEVTDKVLDDICRELVAEFRQSQELLAQITHSVLAWLKLSGQGKVYLGGTHNILKQPEFHNIDKVRHLLRLLEEEPLLLQLLKREPGLKVTIGRENDLPAMHECAVISATYTVRGSVAGTIAVLGPTRMQYSHLVSVLEHMVSCLEEAFVGAADIG